MTWPITGHVIFRIPITQLKDRKKTTRGLHFAPLKFRYLHSKFSSELKANFFDSFE